jgi:hypothetical protein
MNARSLKMSQYLINLRIWQTKPFGHARKLTYELTDHMIDRIEALEKREAELVEVLQLIADGFQLTKFKIRESARKTLQKAQQ